VIVNAANEKMLGGGGVDGAIHTAAGPELLTACRKHAVDKASGNRCKVGEAKLTKGPFQGSKLGAVHVIHTVGPRATTPNRADLLSSAYTSALDLAIENGYSSIAYPSISTGIFQYPKEEAAQTAAGALARFLHGKSDIKSLSKIDLCILDPSNVLLWSKALKSMITESGGLVELPPVDDSLKKNMCVLLYRIRRESPSQPFCMEVLLGHIGNQLVPISAQPLRKDDGGTGADRAQVLALEALRKGTGDLMSSQGLAHIASTISGQPSLDSESHRLWFAFSDDNSSLAQDAAQISPAYALLRKRSDHVVQVAALHWVKVETFAQQDCASFPKVSPQLLQRTRPIAKQVSGILPVLKDKMLAQKFQALFRSGRDKLQAEESSQTETLLKKLDADIAAAHAEFKPLAEHVKQLSIESDPVPPVTSMPESQDIVTLSQPPSGEKLTSGSRQPVRFRKVNMPDREQRFDAYLKSRASGYQRSARSFHGTPTLAAAASIARTGPDLSRAGKNIGKVYGAGFYTDTDPAYPEGVAGNGSVLVCTVAPGKSCPGGNSSTTAASLAAQGFDSVAPNGWHVLFHPDAVRVDYIVDYSFEGDEAAEKLLAQQKAHALAEQQREILEITRKAKLASKLARQTMVEAFMARCRDLVRLCLSAFVCFSHSFASETKGRYGRALPPCSQTSGVC
jgi:O-acetyl-ADP-ribose deacetylase (regulator of RNase III)